MKNKLLSVFVAFVRRTFSKERLSDLISDLLDILYENFSYDEEGSDKDV